MTLERIVKKRVRSGSDPVDQAAATTEDLAVPANLGVLLIDMQDRFVQGLAREGAAKIISHQVKVLDYCREHDVPVFVLEFYGCGETIHPLSDHVSRLRRKECIIKRYNDGFYDTLLSARLQAEEIKTLLLMGINASYCVKRTAAGAINNGFSIMTSGQLIADNRISEFGSAIKWYQRNGQYHNNYQMLFHYRRP